MITFEGPQCMWTDPSKKSRQGSDSPPPFHPDNAYILGTFGPAFPPLHLHLNSHSHVHIKIDGEHSHSIERYFLPQTIHKTFAAKNIWKNIRMIPPNDEKNIALMHTKKVYWSSQLVLYTKTSCSDARGGHSFHSLPSPAKQIFSLL